MSRQHGCENRAAARRGKEDFEVAQEKYMVGGPCAKLAGFGTWREEILFVCGKGLFLLQKAADERYFVSLS